MSMCHCAGRISALQTSRRTCCGELQFIMESGARSYEVIASGKLLGQRTGSIEFVNGLMIYSGNLVN